MDVRVPVLIGWAVATAMKSRRINRDTIDQPERVLALVPALPEDPGLGAHRRAVGSDTPCRSTPRGTAAGAQRTDAALRIGSTA